MVKTWVYRMEWWGWLLDSNDTEKQDYKERIGELELGIKHTEGNVRKRCRMVCLGRVCEKFSCYV